MEAVPSLSLKNKIYKLHLDMPEPCRKAYNTEIKDDDILIDNCFSIIVAKNI